MAYLCNDYKGGLMATWLHSVGTELFGTLLGSAKEIQWICNRGCAGLIGILINKIIETEMTSLVNGGPHKLGRGKLQSRWITKAESSQILIARSFITSSGNPISFFNHAFWAVSPSWSFCIGMVGLQHHTLRTNKQDSMFSGIIEEMATVVAIKKERENVDFTLRCTFTEELKIDQSVAHNGVCLTVVGIEGDTYTVTAMKETLDRSNLGQFEVGDKVNVERSMLMNGRLDGHIVQGHVDGVARCTDVQDADGSTYFTFEYEYSPDMVQRGYFTVDKGSVTVNGVSLTVCNPTENTFSVAIIPYTHDHTNFCNISVGSIVNVEFDILGKYIARLNALAK